VCVRAHMYVWILGGHAHGCVAIVRLLLLKFKCFIFIEVYVNSHFPPASMLNFTRA
jgi:hypothetical protein